MKRLTLVLVVSILISFHVDAAQKAPATIFYADHKEEVTVFVHELWNGYPNFIRLEHGIRYVGADGNNKYVYPNEAKEVRIWFDGKTYRMIALSSSPRSGPDMFAYLVIEGRLSLFLYQYRSDYHGFSHSVGARNTVYLLRRADDYWPQHGQTVTRNRKSYFSDCPSVAKAIKNKMLGHRNLEKFVIEYNSNCGAGTN